MTGGRESVLYRMRVEHLSALARHLNHAGYAATVTRAWALPELHIHRPGLTDVDVIAVTGPDCDDWFRYAPHGGFLTPVAQMEETTRVVLGHLHQPTGKDTPS